MPLTKKGEKILKNMKKNYGAAKGKQVFYSYINKYPGITKSWHLKRR
jgi:hypothetical protein